MALREGRLSVTAGGWLWRCHLDKGASAPSALDQVTVVCLISSSPPQFVLPAAFFGKLGMFTNVAVVFFFFNLQALLVSSELLIIAFTRWTDVYVFVFEKA